MAETSTTPPRRDEALAYIIECLVRLGASPTNQEIGDHLGVHKSRAQVLVNELIDRGSIRRTPGAHRRLEIVDVEQIRMMVDKRMRELGRVVAVGGAMQACSKEYLPILSPFEHLPDNS